MSDKSKCQYVEAKNNSGLMRADQNQRTKGKLDTLLLEGLNSGDPISVDADFWHDLKQEALAKLQSR